MIEWESGRGCSGSPRHRFDGIPVLREIVRRGHDVLALARSYDSASKVAELGAVPVADNIGTPEQWIGALPPLEAVIHLDCDFDSAMAEIKRSLLDILLPYLATRPQPPRFIYTGSCWLYGATRNDVAREETPFHPLPAFAWMVPHLRRVLDTRDIEPIIIHPTIVYESNGGVLRRFVDDAI
jgi:nucleoside-diphosphate-sugar epimerase